MRQRWRDLADDYLKLYPAGSDEEATRSSRMAFRDELAPRWPAFSDASASPMVIGEINETPDPQRLAIYDRLYAKILAGLR